METDNLLQMLTEQRNQLLHMLEQYGRAVSDTQQQLEAYKKIYDDQAQLRDQTQAALQEVERRITELQWKHATSQQVFHHLVDWTTAQPDRSQSNQEDNPRRTVRDQVLDALDDLGWCVYSRELTHYLHACSGRRITAERFGVLGVDEREAYVAQKRPRPVWLCHALTYDRFLPIKRLWVRSDWPLEMRVIAPRSSQVQYLKLTARLCELAGDPTGFREPEVLRNMAASAARDLPGMPKQRFGDYQFEFWRHHALQRLQDTEPADAAERLTAAVRLEQLPEAVQLFGLPEIVEGDGDQRTLKRAPLRLAEED